MRAFSTLLLGLTLLVAVGTARPLAAATPDPESNLSEETFTYTPSQTAPAAVTAPSAATTRTGTVIRNANLRAGPGTTNAIVGSARKGTPLTIVATNPAGDWYQLDTGAWIAAFLVDVEETVATASSPRVLMPTTGTELTLGDGTKIRHSMVGGLPDATNNAWVRMLAGFGTGIPKDGGPISFRHNWALQIKQGDLAEITITDVTGPRFVTLLHETAPAHPNGQWEGASTEVQMGPNTTPWLYQPGDTLFIYQVTLRFANGETITFYQPSSFPGDMKAVLLSTFSDRL
jgi:hypothetical protein